MSSLFTVSALTTKGHGVARFSVRRLVGLAVVGCLFGVGLSGVPLPLRVASAQVEGVRGSGSSSAIGEVPDSVASGDPNRGEDRAVAVAVETPRIPGGIVPSFPAGPDPKVAPGREGTLSSLSAPLALAPPKPGAKVAGAGLGGPEVALGKAFRKGKPKERPGEAIAGEIGSVGKVKGKKLWARTEFSETILNADGSRTVVMSGTPIRSIDDETGVSKTVEEASIASLEDVAPASAAARGIQPAGRIRMQAAGADVSFVKNAGDAFAAAEGFLTIGKAGRRVRIGLNGALNTPAVVERRNITAGDSVDGPSKDASAPVVGQETIVRYDRVLGSASLVYHVSASSLKEEIVLDSAPPGEGPVVFRFPIELEGLRFRVSAKSGAVEFFDIDGVVVFAFDQGRAFDAPAKGMKGGSAPVKVSVEATSTNRSVLVVSVDGSWMRSAERIFPVTIDPSVNLTASSWTVSSFDWASLDEQPVTGGPITDNVSSRLAVTQFDVSALAGVTVDYGLLTTSKLWCTNNANYFGNAPWVQSYGPYAAYSLSTSVAPSVNVPATSYASMKALASAWYLGAYQPDTVGTAGYFDITAQVAGWAANPATAGTVISDVSNGFYCSVKQTLTVTYRQLALPPTGSLVSPATGSTTAGMPTLVGTVGVNGVGAPPAYQQASFYFEACSDAAFSAGCTNSGWQYAPLLAASQNVSWTMPQSSGLTTGSTYYWRMHSWTPAGFGTPTPGRSFVFNATPPTISQVAPPTGTSPALFGNVVLKAAVSQAEGSPVESYFLVYNAAGTPVVSQWMPAGVTEYQIPSGVLGDGQNYTWYLVARSNGVYSAWSPARSFSYLVRPAVVTGSPNPTSTNSTPSFTMSGTSPDGSDISYLIYVCPVLPLPNEVCLSTGWNLRTGTQPTVFTYTVPAQQLYWGRQYFPVWYGLSNGKYATNSATGGAVFTVDKPDLVDLAQLSYGQTPYAIYSLDATATGGVNDALGIFTTSATDAQVMTVGPAMSMTRTYNSADYKDDGASAFGQGWTSLLDTRVQFLPAGTLPGTGTTSALVLLPDGRREWHGMNPDGSSVNMFNSGFSNAFVKAAQPNNTQAYSLTMKDGTIFWFDPTGRPTSIVDRNGNTLTFNLGTAGTGLGRIVSMTDSASARVMSIEWDANGHVASVSTSPVRVGASASAVDNKWTYQYATPVAGATYLIKACDSRAATICTTYNYKSTTDRRHDKMEQIVRPGGSQKHFVTYDNVNLQNAKITSQKDGLNQTTGFEYTVLTTENAITITKSGPYAGFPVIEYYDKTTNKLSRRTDEAGKTSYVKYNDRGFMNLQLNGANEATYYLSDDRGNVTQITDAGSRFTRFQYWPPTAGDKRNDKVTKKTLPGGSVIDYGYDINGNLTSTTQSAPDNPGQATLATATEYANAATPTSSIADCTLGSVSTKITVPAGLPLKTIAVDGLVTNFAYNGSGDLCEVTAPSGAKTKNTYDELGRLINIKEISSTYPTGVETKMERDLLGQVTKVTGPLTLNRVSTVAHQQIVVNQYDNDRRLRKITVSDVTPVASGGDPTRVTDFEYDANDRQIRITPPNPKNLSSAPTIETEYDPQGRVKKVTDLGGHVTETQYDPRGPVKATITKAYSSAVDGTARDITTYLVDTFDDAGRVKVFADAKGRQRKNFYNPDGTIEHVEFLNWINDGVAGAAPISIVEAKYTYDVDGNVTDTVGAAGLRHTSTTYDRAGRVLSQTHGWVPRRSGYQHLRITVSVGSLR
jgi:YD repeat-containing protein